MFSDPEKYGWPLKWALQDATVGELEILLSKDGPVSKEDALEIINGRLRAQGLPPLTSVP